MSAVSSLFSSSEVKSIVSQLQARLDAPITVEQTQITFDKAEISALGKVKSSLSSLNGTLSALADPTSINPITATASNTNATVTATASASPGSYNLTGIKLARSQELYSGSFASASAKVGTGSGTLTFKFGGGTSATISVPSSGDTVSGVVKAINAADKGVTASVVNTASGVKMVLQSTSTGSAQSFMISGTGALSSLNYGSGTTKLTLAQSARNAALSINGVPVTEAGNSSLALLSGLKVSLKASGSTTLSVTKASNSLGNTLSQFATQLNTAISTITQETKFTAGSSAKASASKSSASKKSSAAPLLGSVQVQQLKQDLLGAISSAASGGIAAASLGFSISSAGKISFSSSKLTTAYAKNPTAVNNLVKSIETNVKSVVTNAIGTGLSTKSTSGSSTSGSSFASIGSGFISATTLDLQNSVNSLNKQIAQQSTLGNEQITNLENQFTAAIDNTGSANTSLSYLTALLGTKTSSGG